MQGKFITFEGGEGGGKSTQSKLLLESFSNAGHQVIHTREPGGTQGAEDIRQLLVTGDVARWGAMTEVLLHFAARNDHLEKLIKPSLSLGKYVISDRFIDSTMSYQGYAYGLGRDVIDRIGQMVIGDFKPDLTVILDISIDTGIARASRRAGLENRYEKMGKEFHQRVANGFRDIARLEPQRCVLVDANDTISNIHGKIIDAVNGRLGLGLVASC